MTRRARIARWIRDIALAGVALSAALFVVGVLQATHGGERSADAQVDEGSLAIVVPRVQGNVGGGSPLNGGGSAEAFELDPPDGAACAGNTAQDGYRHQSFMVPVGTDLSTLTFDSLGPIPQGVGAAFRQPLFSGGTPHANVSVASEPAGLLTDFGPFSFDVFGSNAPSIVPEGDYTIGYACTVGAAGPSQLDRFWSVQITITHDPSDAEAGITWAVASAQVPTPTPAPTETPTPTPEPSATPAETPTPTPDGTATPTPDGTATPTPDGTTTPTPDGTTTPTPDGSPTPAPTNTPRTGGTAPTPTPRAGPVLPVTGPDSSTTLLLVSSFLLIVFGRIAILAGREIKVLPPLP